VSYRGLLLLGLIVLLLAGLATCGLSLSAAVRRIGGHADARVFRNFAWYALLTIAVAGNLQSLLSWSLDRDWVHLLWSAEYTLFSLFLASGAWLAELTVEPGSGEPGEAAPRARARTWLPAALFALVASLPLLLLELLPRPDPPARESGAPTLRLIELARFGLGGERPAFLAPETAIEHERGLAHLAREVTVPMGSLMIGAWIAIAVVVLALLLRCAVPRRWRALLGALAPPAVVLLHISLGSMQPTWLGLPVEADWIVALARGESGIWASDPSTLRSFGPLLLTALVAVACLASVRVYELWRTRRGS